METKFLLFHGDKLNLFSTTGTSFSYQVEITNIRPLRVQLQSAVSEVDLNKLHSAGEIILADARRGYAYRGNVASVNGQDIEISLNGRHEDRDFFRVNTVIGLGYEIIKRAPGASRSGADDESALMDFKKFSSEAAEHDVMARMMFSMFSEVRKLREQIQKSTEYDTSIISQRVVSLSGSGIKFISSVEVNKGDVIRVSLMLPDEDRPLIFTCKIVRVEVEMGAPGKTSLSVACNFLEISESCREAIVRFVFQSQRQMLRHR